MTQPPNDVAAERAVLGAVLAGADVDDVAAVLQGRDFYQPRHELVWDACVAVHRRGDRPDVPLVAAQLGQDLQRVGDHTYLLGLYSSDVMPSTSSAVAYAKRVVDRALARRLMEVGQRIQLEAQTTDDVQRTAEDARKAVDDAALHANTEHHGVSASDLLTEVLDNLDADVETGLQTGWPDLDDVVHGLLPGQLIIVGARPGVGKSVLATNLAAHTARQDIGVHMASLEMSRTEVMARILSSTCTVDLGRVLHHRLGDDDWQRVAARGGAIGDWPLWIDDSAPQSLAQLRARVRTTMRRMPLGLVVVDYLQLMAPRDRRVPREQQVGELSEGLKVLAKELQVPIVALAQVNRDSAGHRDARPQLSHLRESGRIEADADQVWLLHRQDLVDPESCTGELEVIVAKNRNGPMTAVHLAFQGHYSRAVSMAT